MWHRSRNDITSDHDAVDSGLPNVVEYRLERREIAVDIIERGDPHGGARYGSACVRASTANAVAASAIMSPLSDVGSLSLLSEDEGQ